MLMIDGMHNMFSLIVSYFFPTVAQSIQEHIVPCNVGKNATLATPQSVSVGPSKLKNIF